METQQEIKERNQRHEYGTSEQMEARSFLYGAMFADGRRIIGYASGSGLKREIAKFELEHTTTDELLNRYNSIVYGDDFNGAVFNEIHINGEVITYSNTDGLKQMLNKSITLHENGIKEYESDKRNARRRAAASGNDWTKSDAYFDKKIAEMRKTINNAIKTLNEL